MVKKSCTRKIFLLPLHIMKKILAILLTIFLCATATAQMENSIVLDTKSFRAVQTDALTGVNIDPIGVDHSRQACARVKIKFDRMNKAQIEIVSSIARILFIMHKGNKKILRVQDFFTIGLPSATLHRSVSAIPVAA